MKQYVPGSLLFHPIVLLSVFVLIVNDHYWKFSHTSAFTGKISDLTGLIFFPLLFISIIELVRYTFRSKSWQLSMKASTLILFTTLIGFTLVKTIQPITVAYSDTLNFIAWLPSASFHWLVGDEKVPIINRIVLTDKTDLIALPGLLISYYLLNRRANVQKCPQN